MHNLHSITNNVKMHLQVIFHLNEIQQAVARFFEMPGRKKKIAVLFASAHQAHLQILKGIEDYSRQQPTWTLNVNPEPFINLAVPSLEGWHGHGVFMRLVNKADIRTAKSLGLPVVNIGGVLHDTGVPTVNSDNWATGRAAAEHLLECGFRRFAYYGLKNTWYSEHRRNGFVQRITEAGAKCSVLEVPNSISRRQPWHIWLARLERWLKTLKPPVGMLAVHDARASLAVNSCLNLGLRVPDDVGIIGADNSEAVCEFAQVRLSSVPPNHHQIGYEAAAMLNRMMIGEPPPQDTLLIPPMEVVRRESTDIIAVEEPHVAAAARYIHEHLREDFSIDDLKNITGISRSGFERLFKEHLGCTPLQYVSRARVRRAKELLLEPSQLPVKQIARACGFSGTQHFRLVFQRLMDMSPTEYRQANAPKSRKHF